MNCQGLGLPAPWHINGDTAPNGKAIVTIGGSSSVRQYGIQEPARLSGFSHIVTNSSPTHVEHLKELGAHVLLERATQSTSEQFPQALDGLPLPLAIDAIVHKSTLWLGIKILQLAKTPVATLVISTAGKEDLVAVIEGKSSALDAEITELAHSGHVVELKGIVGIGSSLSLRHLSDSMARTLGDEDGWIAKGLFVPSRPVVVPGGLSALDDVLEKNKKGVSREKVVIRPFG
ncbi:putative alcohol dehydrogenase [Diaporthe ampelina]|uniref:Putative alcohol dehydrogenase n=1 Tax=Diaporthe ampelina TaxID=1214573 RepID=A0A0G2FYA1_9PEZI|nr:putative alcohol dehydrogenase [Diaporthe ampelina]